MNFNISNDKLDNPLLKDLLKELNDFFSTLNMDFYVIGATARDIILSNLHDLVPDRKTIDLDIAIGISDWNQYHVIEEKLPQREGFEKSREQKQRFIYQEVYILDIVPFGGIAKNDGNIYFPPDENPAMSVYGFPEMAKNSINIKINNEFSVKVASLTGLFLLKLVAWKDRYLSGSKDAYDMALLLKNYLFINTERAFNEHYDLYEAENFDQIVAGAQLMAKDIKQLLEKNKPAMQYFIDILNRETALAEESPLINQLIESDSTLQYEQVLSCLVSMLNEWE
jgi:predicted nucleotidyltransferase